MHSAGIATGISTKSEYSELALEALFTCLCDETINNLLCFGPDCSIESGLANPSGYYNTLIVENRFAHNPFAGLFERDIRTDYMEAYDNCEVSEYKDFTFDATGLEEELFAIQKIYYSVSSEFPSSNYANEAEYLEELNRKLYDAGLQDVLDEANRQLEVYRDES